MLAADIRVTGLVNDDEGLPMINATVLVKGTTQGVITGMDGTYSINVPSENSVLVFSFMGYVKQEITVGTRRVINVKLKADATILEEMVVVGYAVEQKSLMTGSVGVVNGDALKNIPVPTLDGVLQGQASGVQVSQ